MSIAGIVDEIATLLEPTAAKRDSTLARPVTFEPDTLYAWPRNESFPPDGTGDIDQETFDVRVAWLVDASHEVAGGLRSRETSLAIIAKVDAFVALLRGARVGATYEHVEAERVDYESLVTNNARGFYMDLTGYVQQS